MSYRGFTNLIWSVGGGPRFYFSITKRTNVHAFKPTIDYYELTGWFWPGFQWNFCTPRRERR